MAEAKNTFPRECCGLIEGVRSGDVIEAIRLHPTRNLAVEHDRFEIDPALHIALLRTLRGTAHGIVGCYHSHPNGKSVPSPRDRAEAREENFVWLIAGVGEVVALAAFVPSGGHFRPLHICAP